MSHHASPAETDNTTRITGLSCQYPSELLGLPGGDILLRWKVESLTHGLSQREFEIQVASDADFSSLVASTSEESASQWENVAPGPRLKSREVRYIRVRIRTEKGWTPFSETLRYETGLLSPDDYRADAIGDKSSASDPAPILRKTFSLSSAPTKARLYITSRGLNHPLINGVNVHDEYLNPGWTAYDFRLNVATYDVTDLLCEGENAIGVILGDGWHRGKFGFQDQYNNYGDHLALLAQLEIETSSGDKLTVGTDSTWLTSSAQVRFGDIYDGSIIDLNMALPGWSSPGFDDKNWSSAVIRELPKTILHPRISPAVREVARFTMAVEEKKDRTLLRAEQNISGWVELTVDGKKGDTVTVRHAEVLEPGDALHTKALRSAKATDVYILDRDGRHVLAPMFTFHGFQFADVVTEANVVSAEAVAISSDTEPRGRFRSSDTRLNKLHSNVVWSQRDNFVGVPTDCPQRDERLGWTGDAQAFVWAANTLFDTESFWESWLIDLDLDQDENGDVGAVIPDLLKRGPAVGDWNVQGRAGWADAATIVPWAVHESFGSQEVLKRQLPSMRRWVEALHNRRKGQPFLPTEFQFGDWCDPDAPSDEPWKAKVSADFVANAFFVRSADITSWAENLVGDPHQGSHYEVMANELRENLWREMGEEAVATTAGASIALEFDIVPPEQRAAVAAGLANQVRRDKGAISTGFLGTPLILHALSKSGYWEEAFMMMFRRGVRSWLYQVDKGATTIWERWDAIKEDGSIHTGDMATANDNQEDQSMISFNHYAYGAVVDWMYRNIGGIAPDTPGYHNARIAPRPAQGLTYCQTAIETRFGAVVVDWEIVESGKLVISASVPFGVQAKLDLPVASDSTVTVNGRRVGSDHSLEYGSYRIAVTNPHIVALERR